MEQDIWNLRSVNLFDGIPDTELRDIIEMMPVEQFSAGGYIFRTGDHADCLFVLQMGLVKVSYVTLNGDEKILHIFKSGDIFGDLFLGKYHSRIGMAVAMDDVIICRLQKDDFFNLITHSPRVSFNFIQHQANEHRETVARMQALMGMNARNRLLGIFVSLARRYCCTDQAWFTLHESLTQEDLANMAGLNRTTVSSLINEFRRSNLLGGSGRTITLNRQEIIRALEDAGSEILT
jgi:CRP-like cAMP-binding protein